MLKTKPLSLVLFLILSVMATLPFVPATHAAPPAVPNETGCGTTANNCTVSPILTVANAADTVVVTLSYKSAGACANVVLSVTNSLSYAVSQAGSTITNAVTSCEVVGMFYFKVTSTTSVSVTCNFGTTSTVASLCNAFDVQNGGSLGVLDSQSNTGTGSPISTTGTTTYTGSDSILFVSTSAANSATASIANCAAAQTWTPGTNNNGADNGYYCVPTTGGTTSYTTTYTGGGPFREALLGVDFSVNTQVTVIGSCTFFQLQCWWYPLLFMGLYSGFILMVGTWLRTSPRGKTHLFLSAVTFGSLVAVMLGIMNIVFPLLMLILNTIIAIRLRG